MTGGQRAVMYQSIPSLTIPRGKVPRNLFERANSSPPEHKESAKPRPVGQKNRTKTPPPGQLFSKIQQKSKTRDRNYENSTEMLTA